jgi:hypothetical protein
MLNLNSNTLAAVVDAALKDATDHPRWQRAIVRAVAELESNPYVERDANHGGLLILSPSGNIYSANGVCQCEAYTHNHPCWHRAAARLVRRYDEAVATAARPPLPANPSVAEARAEVAEMRRRVDATLAATTADRIARQRRIAADFNADVFGA